MAPDFSHNAMVAIHKKILFPLQFACYVMVFSFHHFSLIGIRMQTMQKVLANCYGFRSLYNTQQQLVACKIKVLLTHTTYVFCVLI